MKFTIDINQRAAVDLGLNEILDIVDLSIFSAFKDFANTPDCEKFMVGKVVYFWIDYNLIINELPLCKIKTKDGVYRRMKNLAAAKIIQFHPDNQKLGRTFFCWGENYTPMVRQRGTDEKPEGVRTKNRRGTDEKPDYNNTNNYTKDNSVSDGAITPDTHSALKENTQRKKENSAARREKSAAHTPKDVYDELNKQNEIYGEYFRRIWVVWNDYAEHRKEMKIKPFASAKSEALAVANLYKISGGNFDESQKIVEQSRALQWRGLFKLKLDTTPEPPKQQPKQNAPQIPILR